jgi:hypothetical protein
MFLLMPLSSAILLGNMAMSVVALVAFQIYVNVRASWWDGVKRVVKNAL